MSEIIKSPINYTGNKYKLLPRLLPLFPQNISTFLDVFGGSGTVSFNVDAEKKICNDYIPYISGIFSKWQTMSLEDIVDYCKKYQHITEEQFLELRKEYNITKDSNILFVLISQSFNGQMRFNTKHEYNSSFAKDIRYLNDNIISNVEKVYPLLDTITFISKDFRELEYDSLDKDSFVYLDPPYSLSRGVYQDGKRGFKGWYKQDDLDLFKICDTLDSKGIKFAMSNVFSSKGATNEELVSWATKYNVTHLNMNYNLGARKILNCKDDEVLIRNFE